MIQKFNRSPFRTFFLFAVEFGTAFSCVSFGMLPLYAVLAIAGLLIAIGMK